MSTCSGKVIPSASIGRRPLSCCRSSVRDSLLGGLGGSVAGPPASSMLAGQGGLLGLDLRQGVGDWDQDGGPVKPEPVASHRPELGERGDQGGLGGNDPGGHAGGDGGLGRREREPAKRTAEAVAGLDQLPKQQLPSAGPTTSANAHRVPLPCISLSVVCCEGRRLRGVVAGRLLGAGRWGVLRACSSPSASTWRPALNRSSRLSTQTCSPRATRAGKRSGGRERKNWCSWALMAWSRTRCSLTEVAGLLTANPMV